MKSYPQLTKLLKHNQVAQQHPYLRFKQSITQSTYHHSADLYFYEDQIFQDLQRTAIVQDYLSELSEEGKDMDIQQENPRMKGQQPYQDLTSNYKVRYAFNAINLLDSQSSGRQLPSRNSSVSSFTSQQQKSYNQSSCLKRQTYTKQQQYSKPRFKFNFQTENEKKLIKKKRQVGSSAEKRQKMNKIKKIQQLGCNCKMSKCLKMYCQCFNLQILCGQNCNCVGCGNITDNESHQKAILDALTRNPKAFAEDFPVVDVGFQLGVQLKQVRKGCKCRKTQCKKKYCECYHSGMTCGIFCQCQQCQNKIQHR